MHQAIAVIPLLLFCLVQKGDVAELIVQVSHRNESLKELMELNKLVLEYSKCRVRDFLSPLLITIITIPIP